MQFPSGECSFLVDAVSDLEDAVSFLRMRFSLGGCSFLAKVAALKQLPLLKIQHTCGGCSFLVNHEGL